MAYFRGVREGNVGGWRELGGQARDLKEGQREEEGFWVEEGGFGGGDWSLGGAKGQKESGCCKGGDGEYGGDQRKEGI